MDARGVGVIALVDDKALLDGLSVGLAVFVLQVAFAVRLGGEAVIAQFTLERLLARVNPHMTDKGAFIVTRVRARSDVALVRRSVHMLLVVALQRP